MSDQKKKNLPPQAQQYQSFQEKREFKRPIFRNCLKAFFIGGLVCFIGQMITTFYIHFFNFTEQTAGNPTVATLIFIQCYSPVLACMTELLNLPVRAPPFLLQGLVMLLLLPPLNIEQRDLFSV